MFSGNNFTSIFLFSEVSRSYLFGFESSGICNQSSAILNLKGHHVVHLPKVLVLQHHCPLLLYIGEVSSFLSLNLYKLATTISISFKFSVMLTSWLFNIFSALNEINFLRDFNFNFLRCSFQIFIDILNDM